MESCEECGQTTCDANCAKKLAQDFTTAVSEEFEKASGVPIYIDEGQHRYYVFAQSYGEWNAREWCAKANKKVLDVRERGNAVIVKTMLDKK